MVFIRLKLLFLKGTCSLGDRALERAYIGPFKELYSPFKGLTGRYCTLFYVVYIYIYMYISFRGPGAGGWATGPFKARTEELRLATGASAPVAR